jgi:exopolysaccharide production protein ExoQ
LRKVAVRKVAGSIRRPGTPRNPSGANQPVGRPASRGANLAGGAGLVLLGLLLWLIFYRNLPDNLGLNQVASPFTDGTATNPDIFAGNIVDRVIKVCVIAVSVYVIATRRALALALVKNINVGAIALLTLAALSAVWSIERSDTILRTITLASLVLLCFAIALAGWHPRRFQQLTVPPLMVILIASLLLGLIFPDKIIELGDDLSLKDAWHGITLTKNQFGMMASIGLIICVNRWLGREGRTAWSIAGAAVAFACLILSRSNTSLFAAMLAVLYMVVAQRVPLLKPYAAHLAVALAGILVLYEMVILDLLPGAHTLLAPVRGLTGKDATFSARTIIWDVVKEHIQAAPYLGSGYGAYWVGPIPSSPSFVFTWKMYFYPTEAHNGYLDIMNDLGYLGLFCLLLFLATYMRQALQLMRSDRNQAALYLALLFQQMVMNLSESEWLARDTTFTILILAIFCLSRGLRESRANVQPSAVSIR